MIDPIGGSGRGLLVAGGLALAAALSVYLGAPGRDGTVSGGEVAGNDRGVPADHLMRADESTAYPAPPEATSTPAPDDSGLYPPPSVPHQIVTRPLDAHGQLLARVESALARRNAAEMAAWASERTGGVAFDPVSESEGFGLRLGRTELGGLLSGVFAAGSSPVVQGYFELGGCRGDTRRSCWPIFVVTGLVGGQPLPTRAPEEQLGPVPPAELPGGAAAWELFDGQTGPQWVAWRVHSGYYALVQALSDQGLGEYFVLR